MTYPLVRLVSGPTPDAEILLDLSDMDAPAPRAPESEGWSIGYPEIQGDPDALFVQYGLRFLEHVLQVRGTKAQALAFQSQLGRRLMRDSGWLYFKLAAGTDPVWFELKRAQAADLSFDGVYVNADGSESNLKDHWGISLNLPAEPFALGERRSLGTFTVTNDPTTGQRIVLPEIEGDAPANLRITVNPDTATTMAGFKWKIDSHNSETAHAPVVWNVGTGDGFTAGAGTGAGTSNAAYSGGTYREITFADLSLVTRISGPVSAPLPAGDYEVLVRVTRDDAASVFSLRFGQMVGLGYQFGDTVLTDRLASTATGHATYVSLGVHALPKFQPPEGEDPGATPTPDIALQVGRVSGAGAARVDAIKLLPVRVADTISHQSLLTHFPGIGIEPGTNGRGIWDTGRRAFWAYNASGNPSPALTDTEGTWPIAVPGVENSLVIMPQVNGRRPFFGNDASDDIAMTSEIEVSYQPRHLWIGGR